MSDANERSVRLVHAGWMIQLLVMTNWLVLVCVGVLEYGRYKLAREIAASRTAETAQLAELRVMRLREMDRRRHVCNAVRQSPLIDDARESEVILRHPDGLMVWDNGELRDLLSLCTGRELGR